jgi:cell wall-associated NlpC family hydrolase
MITPADVVAAARSHLETRWMHQQRLPGVALDCAGLVIVVARQLGMVPDDFDIGGYGREPDGRMLALCEKYMQPLAHLEAGAVIVLQTDKDPQHLGILAPHPLQAERPGLWNIIHASQHAGRVVETRLMFSRNFRLRGIFRLPGVEA